MTKRRFPKILGTATLNEKGQLVIPVDARNNLGLGSGDKVVIMGSPHKPALILVKAEEIEELVKDISNALNEDPAK